MTTSLAIQSEIDRLNQTLPAEGIPIPPFAIGIGIHHGASGGGQRG
ncbi:MAG: hypothetical protein HC922_01775 [Leptolyngbyaceae cyanobacterium SM2_3_12]|nr:hypothetical protein [Leptolyngbyaceae cyanobacterium SM2_3_12]